MNDILVFRQKYRDKEEMNEVVKSAETLKLKYEIDWDARESSMDDPLYEVFVYCPIDPKERWIIK